MVLKWSDEFDGPAGSAPDPRSWAHEIGGGGWGDAQRQSYTSSTTNAAITADGQLAITAAREATGEITSARLETKGLRSFRYGTVEARIQVPRGRGVWPAVWMLGSNIDEVGWPACGEIDIMEHVGSEPTAVHGTVHGPGFAGVARGIGRSIATSTELADDFHIYGVRWEPDRITWLLDGSPYFSVTPDDLPAGGWVYDHEFYLLINVAIGGSWPGNDSEPDLPVTLLVDWVRVNSLEQGDR
jgi:beta-glucanase (GH16 family)